MRRSPKFYVLLCIIIVFLSFGTLSRAATITVDTTDDDQTANGNCTLCEAIIAANNDTAVDNCTAGDDNDDTIDLTGVAGTITLGVPLPHITENLTITGAGASSFSVDANGTGGVINIDSVSNDQTVNISGLRITGGNLAGNGGGVYVYSGDTLNLSSCNVDSNAAALDGGGIMNDQGTVTLTDCTVGYNTATNRGGGIMNFNGTLTLINTSVSDNTSTTDDGGGIFNYSGTVSLTNSTVSGNVAAVNGGGIRNNDTMSLTDSTVSDNSTDNHGGGGIYNSYTGALTLIRVTISLNTTPDWYTGGGIWNNGSMSLTDSTVSGNTSNYSEGGISNQGTATLTNTTVSGNTGTGILNSAATGANITLTNCTIAFNNDVGITNWQTATLKNTIVANNTSSDCSDPITSDGYNLDSDSTCGLMGTGDLSNTDPLLGPLQNNGGPTLTHALLSGSPAIDAGDNIGSPATDQRSVARPQDGDGDGNAVCDIGAYELEATSTEGGSGGGCFITTAAR